MLKRMTCASFLSLLLIAGFVFAAQNPKVPMKLSSSTQIANTLAKQMDALIAAYIPTANLGMVVMDAESGKLLYTTHPYEPFHPASNLKLLTATAALMQLGSNYRYVTTIKINPKKRVKNELKGNLYITFSGDPSFQAEHLNQLIRQVKQAGITRIFGNIVIDNTRFQRPVYAPGAAIDDMNWYYAAPVTSIILNQNYVNVTLAPSKTLGKRITLFKGPYAKLLTIQNHVYTTTYEQAFNECQLLVDVTRQNVISFSGCWPMLYKKKTLKIAIKKPFLFAAKLIRLQLKTQGIVFTGQIRLGKTPKGLKLIAMHKSLPLSILIKDMLKMSNNLYANAITKTLGRAYYGRGTFQAGALAIKAILHKQANIDFTKASIREGSGTVYNLVTPYQIARLLFVVYHSPKIKADMMQALAKPGQNGTLKKRMQSFDLVDNVYAKTGTLTGTSALSGYLKTYQNKVWIFVMLVNHYVDKASSIRNFQDKACELLSKQ